LWGTPMRFLFGRNVYTVRHLTPEREILLDTEIAKWQTAGHTVYWVEVPSSQLDYQPTGDWKPITNYTLSFDMLEQTYERKPIRVDTQSWTGTIFALEPSKP